MRMRGLEPPRPERHTDLNRARLPIPPHPRADDSSRRGRFGHAAGKPPRPADVTGIMIRLFGLLTALTLGCVAAGGRNDRTPTARARRARGRRHSRRTRPSPAARTRARARRRSRTRPASRQHSSARSPRRRSAGATAGAERRGRRPAAGRGARRCAGSRRHVGRRRRRVRSPAATTQLTAPRRARRWRPGSRTRATG